MKKQETYIIINVNLFHQVPILCQIPYGQLSPQQCTVVTFTRGTKYHILLHRKYLQNLQQKDLKVQYLKRQNGRKKRKARENLMLNNSVNTFLNPQCINSLHLIYQTTNHKTHILCNRTPYKKHIDQNSRHKYKTWTDLKRDLS